MILFEKVHPKAKPEMLGYIPSFLSEQNPKPAKEQLHQNYLHGGGWQPFEGFTLNQKTLNLHYPGDPPVLALAKGKLRDETIVVYQFAWVAIIQPDGTYEVARMD